ncbi:hypothetical protein HA050_15455 [Iodobacter sp. HSC-16F04]|uniref:Alkaline phytoceramidase n=1 Tax=Iodobacter violaceini TaxID=3044271 RepID=A0ABX0KZL0_9NEIS|nr:hypothetical protein [Iodobacter violacea]NHQ87514.1 hypothetical protein [Iodobacter violacea]
MQYQTHTTLARFKPALCIIALLALLMLWHGPIAQHAHYHDFADQRAGFGLPNLSDVLSNLGFAIIGIWGLKLSWPQRGISRAGWLLGFFSLILTALGSAWYHLAPDDTRLIWDRLPIALACAGFLAALASQLHGQLKSQWFAVPLAFWAVGSVGHWVFTQDLRPYLLLQALPLILLPLWQWQISGRRPAFWLMLFASLCYILAKITELQDQVLFNALHQILSGHTLKHLFASIACLFILQSRKYETAHSPV